MSTGGNVIEIVYSAINALLLVVLSFECFRNLQSFSYRPQRGYIRVLITPYFATLIAAQIATALFYVYGLPEYAVTIAYFVIACPWTFIRRKCSLKFTKRIIRMLLAEFAVLFLLCFFVNGAFFAAALPIITLIAWAICLPIDYVIGKYYLKKACKKLENSDVTVIAVTGSYGKTSVKDMLTAILDDSVSPNGSCNTPLGIAGFINKTDLYYVKYLILEFGARRKGDIAELCELFKPKYGIITGVCEQHLSTFKSMKNIIATKRELIEYLPENGACVLNDQDEIAVSFATAGTCAKFLSHNGLSINVDNVGFDGTKLSVGYGKIVKKAVIPHITEYAPNTFAICLQTALLLKQSFTKTLARTVYIKQTPHRMELIKTERGFIVDDGYNGSIAGVASCASTLAKFHVDKIVISQGLVECGKQRKEMNKQCGRILGKACDIAIVLGKNAKYLAAGIGETDCKVIFAKNLKQAVQFAQPYVNETSILLFQNDIPD